MSYGNLIQKRLGFNFDKTKFGNAIDPDGNLQEKLSVKPPVLSKNTATAYNQLGSSISQPYNYYQNPLAGTISNLATQITLVYTTIWDYNATGDTENPDYLFRLFVPDIVNDYTSLMRELTEDDTNTDGTVKSYNTFISHVDRLSNLKVTNSANRPSFGLASILTNIQTLVYQTETTDTDIVGSMGLGFFTSLFIKSDLISILNDISEKRSSLTTLLTSNPTTNSSELKTLIVDISALLKSLLSLLVERRTHDENFYVNATAITQDLGKIQSFSLISKPTSGVSAYLINNLIGSGSTS